MPTPSRLERRYFIYHPIVTKLLVPMLILGLLMIVVSSDDGNQSLDGIHVALNDHAVWVVLLLGVLFIVSALSPFFPEFMLSVATGFIFGFAYGSAFAIVSVSLAAWTNFTIARRDGRRVIEHIFDLRSAREIRWTAPHITPVMVFLTWFLPSINHDLISYVAGLSRMRYQAFFALTIAGTTLSSVILSFLGDRLQSGQATTVVAVLLIYTFVGTALYAKELPPWFARLEEAS